MIATHNNVDDQRSISWTSTAETFAAVTIYWVIAWRFNTHIHLFTSVLIAPFMLLRSTKSTDLGLKLFQRYWEHHTVISPSSTPFRMTLILFIGILSAFSISAETGKLITLTKLIEYQKNLYYSLGIRALVAAFPSGVITGCISAVCLTTASGCGATPEYGKSGRISASLSCVIAVSAFGAVGSAFGAIHAITNYSSEILKYTYETDIFILAIYLSLVTALTTGIIIFLICAQVSRKRTNFVEALVVISISISISIFIVGVITGNIEIIFIGLILAISVATILFPDATGIWVASIGIRFVATLCYLPDGIRSIPSNWSDILFRLKVINKAELIPGLSLINHPLSFGAFYSEIRNGDQAKRIMYIIVSIIFFIPPLIYRFSLKSTCWLYIPIIYLTSNSQKTKYNKIVWMSLIYDGRLEHARRLVCIAVLINTVVSSISLSWISKIKNLYPHAEIIWYIAIFDLRNLTPWQWLNLASSLVTIMIFFESQRTYRYFKITGILEVRFYLYLELMVKLRNLTSLFAMILTMGYAALVFFDVSEKSIPKWLGFINYIYLQYL